MGGREADLLGMFRQGTKECPARRRRGTSLRSGSCHLLGTEKYDLPTFVGSDRQVAWAIRSRHTLIQSAYDVHVTVGKWDETDFEEQVLEPARVLDRPSWWIDNREALGVDVPELVQSSVTDPRAASTENPL